MQLPCFTFNKVTLTKVAYCLKLYYHISFEVRILCGANVAPTSHLITFIPDFVNISQMCEI
jgi:hypothetical protein